MARKLVDKVLGFMGFEEEPVEEEEKGQKEGLREAAEEVSPQIKRKGQVLSLHAQRQLRVVVVEPRMFEEVQGIAEHLKNRRPVIINLEQADGELARRVVDFVSGVTYALNGSMQKVGNGIFLFVPSNMDITGDIREHVRERGILSWMNSD